MSEKLLFVEVDRESRLVAFSEGWDALAERHGLVDARAEILLGRTVDQLLDPEARSPWEVFLDAAFAARPDEPPTSLSREGLLAGITPWPIFDVGGRIVRLRLYLAVDLDALLGRPLLARDDDGVSGWSEAGRGLLDAAREDEMAVDEWLGLLQPPRRAEPTGLRLDDASIEVVRPIPALRGAGSAVLCRSVRAGLHDLANPLAGVRMLAEVARRRGDDGTLGEMVRHLDQVQDTLRRLRGLLHVDLRRKLDLRGAFARAGELLASELGRRDVTVEIDALPEESGFHEEAHLLPLALALLLASVGRSAEGDRIVLALVPREDTVCLEAHVAGSRRASTPSPPTPGPPDPEIETEFLRVLVSTVGGRLAHAPGARADRDPDWAIEWPRGARPRPRDQSRSR